MQRALQACADGSWMGAATVVSQLAANSDRSHALSGAAFQHPHWLPGHAAGLPQADGGVRGPQQPGQDNATLLQHLLQLPEGVQALLTLMQQGAPALAQLAVICDVPTLHCHECASMHRCNPSLPR